MASTLNRQLLFAVPEPWYSYYREAVADGAGGVRVVSPEAVEDTDQVRYALTLSPPEGYLARFPKLEAVMPLGAGVEYILSDRSLPEDVKIVRFVQPDMVARMSEYVMQHVLNHHRQFRRLAACQANQEWILLDQPVASDRTVGIMGFGVLGSDAAARLVSLGFKVRGWSRRPKSVPGIEIFSCTDELEPFLSGLDVLVCLLPLTSETHGLLNRSLMAKLPVGASIINASRGAILVDDDLIALLESGHLSEATLDAFSIEPLPEDHIFWRHPAITVTPHCASAVTPDALRERLREVIGQLQRGEEPSHVVDRAAGY